MLPWAGTPKGPAKPSLSFPFPFPFPWEGGLRTDEPFTSFQLPAVSFLCRRRENMKSPSRWGSLGKPAQPCLTAQQQSSQLPAVPPPPVHTTWEEMPPIPQNVVLSPPAMPARAYFLGTTAHLGPFLGSKSGASASRQNTAGAQASRTSILLTLFRALDLQPGIHRQSGSASLHVTAIQPWHVAPCSRVNLTVAETVPGRSSQGHHQWPKLLSTVTSG